MKNRRVVLILLFSALSLPLLQTIIWLLGASLSNDLYHQFDEPLFHEQGPRFVLIAGGILQCLIAIFLGGIASVAFTSRPHICRAIHLFQGATGAMFFGWYLAKYWNFASNHANSEIMVTSPLVFDFEQCVFFGLPLLWCLGLIFFVVVTRTPDKPLPSN